MTRRGRDDARKARRRARKARRRTGLRAYGRYHELQSDKALRGAKCGHRRYWEANRAGKPGRPAARGLCTLASQLSAPFGAKANMMPI